MDFFIDIEHAIYYDFVRKCNNILQNANVVEMNLRLFSKNIFQLKIFVKVGEYLLEKTDENEKDEKVIEEFKQFIDLIKNEIEILNQNNNNPNNIEKLKNILEEEYKFLKNKFQGKRYELILGIFGIKLTQIQNEEYHKKILQIVLSEKELILRGQSIFSIILDKNIISPKLGTPANKEELKEKFLSFTNQENSLFEIFENEKKRENNIIIDEILLYLFESYVNAYFESIQGDEQYIIQQTLFGLSLDYLDKSLIFIDSVLKKNENILYEHLGFLLSVGYIKCYLARMVDIITNNKKLEIAGDLSIIMKTIEGTVKNKFRYVIKIYILKLIRNKTIDYESFLKYDFSKSQLEFMNNKEEFNLEDTIENSLDYFFLPLDYIEKFDESFTIFFKSTENKFKIEKEYFISLIKEKNGFDIFITHLINQLISNFTRENYIQSNKSLLDNFSSWTLDILNSIQPPEILKEFIKLFTNPDKFLQTLSPNIQKIPINEYEMLLFSFRLISNCLLSGENNFYRNLLSPNMLNYIKENYIPGEEPNESRLINSAQEIERFLRSTPDVGKFMAAAYICPCGQWYEVASCGFPMVESQCFVCLEKIGGQSHHPVDREGHFRIFKNESQQNSVMNSVKSWFVGKVFRCKTLQVLNKELEDFIKSEHSFIFFSYLFYGKVLGYIDDNTINNNLLPSNSKSLYDTILRSWKLLENALKSKGINEIQIFLHLIYPKLIEILKSTQKIETPDIRKDLEKKVTNLIDENITIYNEKKEEYIKYNNKFTKSDMGSMRSILQELFSPLLYSTEEFPFLKYFMITKYPSKKNLEESLKTLPNYNQKYPILTNLLSDEGEVECLQNLSKINPFLNSMIEIYSYKITRDKAKELKIGEELRKLNNHILNKQFENFKEGWKNFCDFLTKKQNTPQKEEFLLKYHCRPPMEPKYITEEDPIANVLNDDGEFLFGMNLAAAYQKFIDWQTKILGNIISSNSQNGVLLYFKDQISKEIYAQDATSSEIISFNLKNENSMFNNLEEIISAFSKRKCINNDGSINYTNYKIIEYDFDLIEEEIGKIILPGKKSFKGDSQKFVTYGFEGYRGGKSTVISDFINKYNQNPLEKEERKILFNFSQERRDFNSFMFSLQLLIFYLKNENYQDNFPIKETIDNIPDYVNIGEECKEFFENNQNFKLNTLISIFEYIELLCYPQIIENVNDDYKVDIEQDEIDKINTYFNDNNDSLISKQLIATTVRRLISRFLSGKRGENEIKEDENLLYFLQAKEEFWSKDLFNNPKFDEEFEKMICSFTVNVNQAIKFYDVLGGDKELLGDKKEFEDIEKKENYLNYFYYLYEYFY